ncbi:MAG: hypothetical protein A3G49_03890 [Candidatus Sungbacteria bacterium RIFCSPLOWO2_12_FULL_41_11]|uniref:Uncharacterized protein n=1 Tax=Candidatus Sungbacteria bacterium RIFCSPLOWO2_12_FULL_41_11 TaxID=1802286 RepID=A0A1G2LMF7_9BACT|nr:MAG: hypothetical protein A3D41_03700 [Candidatus Sungbacteria bacterium RIFCSPHIGHO2_02_FULL_41_12b]OHA12817.1 MAG: hypothetical protein A3G49_03890 [Candidatus Sungbacteria bacterium RIFCSPLOWO2_12_FULL_41_11]
MIFVSYLYWHYTYGFRALLKEVSDLTDAFYNFFSVIYLLNTLFYPWHRYIEPYKSGFYVSELLWTLSQNLISRILGATVRLATVLMGIIITFLTIVIGFSFVLIWLILPVLIPIFFSLGIIVMI